jgi:hypothetical protein
MTVETVMAPSLARRTFGTSASAPTASSTSAVPIVGWSANGSSVHASPAQLM